MDKGRHAPLVVEPLPSVGVVVDIEIHTMAMPLVVSPLPCNTESGRVTTDRGSCTSASGHTAREQLQKEERALTLTEGQCKNLDLQLLKPDCHDRDWRELFLTMKKDFWS